MSGCNALDDLLLYRAGMRFQIIVLCMVAKIHILRGYS